jgi:enoyl-CoA hydratase
MSKTSVHVAVLGSQASITFSTEDGLNVLSSDVLPQLRAAIHKVASDRNVRTTIVQATGKVFVAGADIKEMSTFSRSLAREYGQLGQDVFNDLASLPSITVAAINGAALGGGLEVALACDFRLAVKTAKLGLPEVSLGLIPGWAGIPRLTKLIGPSKAKKLFLSAAQVSGEEAHTLGLVDEVVNSIEDLHTRVVAFCKHFQKASPAAVALAKRAARDGDDLDAFADCFETKEGREGMTAFLEKRAASWME